MLTNLITLIALAIIAVKAYEMFDRALSWLMWGQKPIVDQEDDDPHLLFDIWMSNHKIVCRSCAEHLAAESDVAMCDYAFEQYLTFTQHNRKPD